MSNDPHLLCAKSLCCGILATFRRIKLLDIGIDSILGGKREAVTARMSKQWSRIIQVVEPHYTSSGAALYK